MASGGLKVFTAGVTAAAGGVAALGAAAVSSYADFEQLKGGIETLFGTGGIAAVQDYADSVGKTVDEVQDEFNMLTEAQELAMSHAASAYKDAGLSANEYMSTVTSFAASLKASTENEVEAAEAANKAVIAMADNANKMGTDMTLIQNAYQGFAKQNYTMLDNLKLGYGGTKTEMERLLADAEKLTGIKYDINNLSDVYSAIQAIQDELGITGTTAAEAATTISGSASAMKAAWSNLLTGMADDSQDFDTLVANFVDSVSVYAGNILPRVETAISGIGQLIEELLPVIVERIPEALDGVLPNLLQSGINMISSLLEGIQQNLPQLMASGGEILATFASGIIQVIPMLASTAYEIVVGLLNGIISNAGTMISSGSELLLQFITGIASKIPELLVTGVEAVVSLAMALTEPNTLSNIIEAGLELLMGLLDGIMQALPKLLEAAPVLMARFASAIIAKIPRLLAVAVEILAKLAMYMISSVAHLLAAVPQLFISLVNSFKSMDWGSIGSNILDGIWDGISAGWSWLVQNVKDLASSLFSAAQDALDIHSPSRKFKWLGEMCVAGFDDGIEDLMSPDGITRNVNASLSTMRANTSVVSQQASNNQYQIDNNVQVYLEGDAKGVFKLVKTENNNAIRTTGVNPLMVY